MLVVDGTDVKDSIYGITQDALGAAARNRKKLVEMHAAELAHYFALSVEEECAASVLGGLVSMWMADVKDVLPLPAPETWGCVALAIAEECLLAMVTEDAAFDEALYQKAVRAHCPAGALR